MKIFPNSGTRICSHYLNEKKLIHKNHENVIQFLDSNDDYFYTTKEGIRVKASYIIMEYAPYNDFHHLIIEAKIQFDDRLARTYFHQLIKGLEYLHSQGVYHLDLKLDNLLVGADF